MRANELIEEGHQLDVDVVELCDSIPLATMTDSELYALRNQAEAAHITLNAGTSGVEPEHLRTYLEVCKKLNASRLRVLLHSPRSKPTVEVAVSELRTVMPEFENAGVTVMIENHDSFTRFEMVEVMQRVNSPRCRICLDTANSLGMLESTAQVIETLGKYVDEVHYKDYRIDRLPHLMGFEITGTAAGEGSLNPEPVVDLVASQHRDIPIIAELWPPYVGTIDASIARERKWVRQSVAYLTGIDWSKPKPRNERNETDRHCNA
jgi:sugar phosphate isomerase/epimerase